MTLALTSSGLTIQTADEIRADIAAQIGAKFGASMQAQALLGTTVIGQIVSALAVTLLQVQEGLDGVYQSGYVDGADGSNLDRLVLLLGLTRNLATSSTVTATFSNPTGAPITVPAGATYQNAATGDVFYLSSGALLVPAGLTADGTLTALTTGPVPVPATITWQSVAAYAGSTSITVANALAGTTGTDQETDADLRLRALQSAHLPGKTTIDAIRAAIADVSGVTEVSVFENTAIAMGITTPVAIPLLPGKSFVAVVKGGTDQAVGDIIWANKAAGIGTYGSTTVTVTDSEGFAHTVDFERCTPKAVTYVVTITGASATYSNAVKAALIAYTNALLVGETVVLIRAVAAAVDAAGDNVTDCTLTINGVAASLAVPWNQYADTNSGAITVNFI